MKSDSCLKFVLPCIYLVVFAAAMAYLFKTRQENEFCGMFALLVTMPWSMLGLKMIHGGTLSFSGGIILVCMAALMNAGCLFLIGAFIDQFFTARTVVSECEGEPRDSWRQVATHAASHTNSQIIQSPSL